MQNVPAPAAHTGTAVSIVTAVLSFAASAEPVVSVVCACVGIVSGAFAIAFYRKRLKE